VRETAANRKRCAEMLTIFAQRYYPNSKFSLTDPADHVDARLLHEDGTTTLLEFKQMNNWVWNEQLEPASWTLLLGSALGNASHKHIVSCVDGITSEYYDGAWHPQYLPKVKYEQGEQEDVEVETGQFCLLPDEWQIEKYGLWVQRVEGRRLA